MYTYMCMNLVLYGRNKNFILARSCNPKKPFTLIWYLPTYVAMNTHTVDSQK